MTISLSIRESTQVSRVDDFYENSARTRSCGISVERNKNYYQLFVSIEASDRNLSGERASGRNKEA